MSMGGSSGHGLGVFSRFDGLVGLSVDGLGWMGWRKWARWHLVAATGCCNLSLQPVALWSHSEYRQHAMMSNCRHRRQQTNNDDVRWQRRMYISANDLRHNSPGQLSSQSSTSGRESTSGSILKKRPDCSSRPETSSSCSSSTIVGSAAVGQI